MEAQQRPRKRKQYPSNSLTGVVTRQRSQLFAQITRSGKSPPNPVREFLKYQKSPQRKEDDDDDAVYHMSIKDLRTRRIFSKPLVPNVPKTTPIGSLRQVESGMNLNPNDGKLENSKLRYEPNDGKLENSSLFSDPNEWKLETPNLFSDPNDENLKSPNLSVVGKPNSREDVECEGLDGGSPSLSDSIGEKPNSTVVETCDRVGDIRGEGLNNECPSSLVASIEASDVKEEISGILDGSKERNKDVGFKCIATISNVLSPLDMSERDLKRGIREDCEGFTEDNVQKTPPEALAHIQQTDDGSASQNRGCSTLPPKKISPRKEKNISSDPKRNMILKTCSRMKVYKAPYSFSYRRLLPFLMDMANETPCAPKVNPCPKTEIDAPKFDEKQPAMLPGFTPEDVKGSSEFEGSDLRTDEEVEESPVNCSEDERQMNLVSPQREIKNPNETLGDVSLIVKPDGVDSSFAPEQSAESLRKDANSAAQCHELALYQETECRTPDNELKTSIFPRTANLEAFMSSPLPADSLAKGILRRNPRGCRGICDCLNCTSFRLNAGKAFEFSKNQMLDTQELVHDMMNELSNLRIMLAKSVDGSKNHAILPDDQVQEACRRASNMEDIARKRLSQMNQDLYVHCRTKSLERPRVNFSSNVEEKVMEKSSKQIHQNNASRSLTL